MKNLSEREYFIEACFAEDLQSWYKEWVYQKKDRVQFFNFRLGSEGIYEHNSWCPSKVCCDSGKTLIKEDMDVKSGYWTPHLWKPIHKDLLKEAKAFEAMQCQIIDADCNDCKYFKRGKELGTGITEGLCLKFNYPTKGYVNVCSGKNCFEHRKL